jgi:uncharacterized protein
MQQPEYVPELQFILKLASRCNLNCSYCYVYNKGDESWRGRPKFMSDVTFDRAIKRILRHCQRSRQGAVRITFHGGEPCLVGPARFRDLCARAHAALDPVCYLEISLQTNGVLLDDAWVEVFKVQDVSVGVSLDGPADVHDRLRVDRRGRGSHAAAVRGLALLRDARVPLQVLCVIQLGSDGPRTHEYLLGLGVKRVNYLLPDFTHDTIGEVRARYGATPVADFLLPVLDLWYSQGRLDVKISPFTDMARVVLGGDTYIDLMGNRPYQYVFVETDGRIEGLDVLRICGDRLAVVGLDVAEHDFAAIPQASHLHGQIMLKGLDRPGACARCVERDTCGGGYLPHRHSAERGFDNPSVWCLDMLALFGQMRELMGVSAAETALRRESLQELANGAR